MAEWSQTCHLLYPTIPHRECTHKAAWHIHLLKMHLQVFNNLKKLVKLLIHIKNQRKHFTNSLLATVFTSPTNSPSTNLKAWLKAANIISGNTKGGSITVPLNSCLTSFNQSVLQIKTKNVSGHSADSKPVKQEVNGAVILPLQYSLIILMN